MMNRLFRRSALVMATAALAACGGSEEEPEVASEVVVATEPAAPAEGAMGGMEGMQGGMEGMQMGGGTMEQMQAHMQAMEGESAEQFKANLPQHRQMVANMIAQMNREMRDMNMTADAEWNSTIDAVRADLTRLPEMTTAELESFMPEHRERVRRLMEMHHGMMGNMQM